MLSRTSTDALITWNWEVWPRPGSSKGKFPWRGNLRWELMGEGSCMALMLGWAPRHGHGHGVLDATWAGLWQRATECISQLCQNPCIVSSVVDKQIFSNMKRKSPSLDTKESACWAQTPLFRALPSLLVQHLWLVLTHASRKSLSFSGFVIYKTRDVGYRYDS